MLKDIRKSRQAKVSNLSKAGVALLCLWMLIPACSHQTPDPPIGCNNVKAKEIVAAQIAVIRRLVDATDPIQAGPVNYCIDELERITGIKSESDGSPAGRVTPTKNDAERWEAWFEEHKQQLCYDPFDSLVYVRQ